MCPRSRGSATSGSTPTRCATGPWAGHGPATRCDVEDVAVAQCGYPRPPTATTDDRRSAYAAWRQPLRATEESLRRRLRSHRFARLIRWTLVAWGRAHGLGPAHLFLRYPPCFAAVVGEAFADVLLAHPAESDGVRWDGDAIAATLERSLPHPYQAYTVWLAAGVPTVPDGRRLRRDWDADDRAVAAACGGRYGPSLREYWRGSTKTAGGPPANNGAGEEAPRR